MWLEFFLKMHILVCFMGLFFFYTVVPTVRVQKTLRSSPTLKNAYEFVRLISTTLIIVFESFLNQIKNTICFQNICVKYRFQITVEKNDLRNPYIFLSFLILYNIIYIYKWEFLPNIKSNHPLNLIRNDYEFKTKFIDISRNTQYIFKFY